MAKKNAGLNVVAKVDPTLPFTEIDIDDVPHKAVITFGVCAEVAAWLRRAGHPGGMMAAIAGMDFDTVPLVLWASLRTYHPDLTFEQVVGMVTLDNIYAIKDKLVDAFVLALPKPNPPKAAPQEA